MAWHSKGPSERAKLWVKYIKQILQPKTKPISLWRLTNDLVYTIRTFSIRDPESQDPALLLPLPNKEFLKWMVDKKIINRYTFQNRLTEYFGMGLSVTYSNMDDDPDDDKPVNLPAHPKKDIQQATAIETIKWGKGGNRDNVTADELIAMLNDQADLIKGLETKVNKMEERIETLENESYGTDKTKQQKVKRMKEAKT